jgi:putative membrane protein
MLEVSSDPSIVPVSPPQETVPQQVRAAQRLHVATLWLPAADAIFRLVFPAFIASLFVGPFALLWFGGIFYLLPIALIHAIRYFTLTYEVTSREVLIQSGIVFRRERRIPLDRIQEVKIQQGVLHRVLGLAKATLTTAGSDAEEASLNVLESQAAQSLKSAVTLRQSMPNGACIAEVESHLTEHDFEFQLDIKTLLLGGFTSTVVATIGAILSAIIYFQLFLRFGGKWFNPSFGPTPEEIRGRLPDPKLEELWQNWTDKLPDTGPVGMLVDLFLNETLFKSMGLAIGGLFFTIAAYTIRYYGFRLERQGDLLNTSYGLFTRHHGTLARDRIQALKLEEGLLRRLFGLATLRVDSAGDRNQVDEQKHRETLLPVARKRQAEEVARQVIPGLQDLSPEWQRVSRRAILRGSNKGWLLILLAMVQGGIAFGWYAAAWLPAFPLVYLLNVFWYRNAGYWLGDGYLLWRSGWLHRSTICLPIRNVQNVALTQSPFDRRLGLATLSIDTAGQSNTGGGPRIKHLTYDQAKQMQKTLTAMAAESEFVW